MVNKDKKVIVTFGCSNHIHVYNEGCGLEPMFPYKLHKNLEDAKKWLEERSLKNNES